VSRAHGVGRIWMRESGAYMVFRNSFNQNLVTQS